MAERLSLIRSLEGLSLALNFCPRHPPVEPGANVCVFAFPTVAQTATCGFLVCHQLQKLTYFSRPVVTVPSLSTGQE